MDQEKIHPTQEYDAFIAQVEQLVRDGKREVSERIEKQLLAEWLGRNSSKYGPEQLQQELRVTRQWIRAWINGWFQNI